MEFEVIGDFGIGGRLERVGGGVRRGGGSRGRGLGLCWGAFEEFEVGE